MTSAPLPAPLPETLKPEWVAETDWRAENDRASAFEHGVIDAGDGLVIILASTDYFYDEEPSRILRFRDELCAAWNRRAPEAQAWRAGEGPKDGTVVWLAGHHWGDPRLKHWVTRGSWREVDGTTGWHDLDHAPTNLYPPTHWMPDDPPAPPGATPAAPPAREAALVEALREISESHIPSMPMTAADDELAWAQKHVAHLRRIALKAISGEPT